MQKISEEINLVIQHRVQQLGKEKSLRQDECTFLQEQLTKVAHRTYLWVYLTLDLIQNTSGFTRGSIRRAIRTLPQSVLEAYEKILNRSLDKTATRKLLHIVTAASRPLSVNELAEAMAIQKSHESYQDLEEELEPEMRFRNTVRDLCGLFVVIVDSKIYLLHQTAREFLVRDPKNGQPDDETFQWKWKYSLHADKSNRILVYICLWYLNFTRLETLRDICFLNYSAANWATHFRNANIFKCEELVVLALRVCDIGSKRFNTWYTIYRDSYYDAPERPTPLILASYFGLEAVARQLLDDGCDTSTKQKLPKRVLQKALASLLRGRRAMVTAKDEKGLTPLAWAAENGHEAVVRLLAQRDDVDVDAKDRRWGQTPLSYAASEGHEAAVKLLAERKDVDVNAEDYWNRTPLLHAAMEGHEAVVRLLAQREDVATDAKDNDGRTPLLWAARNGHEMVVRLLAEREDVAADAKDNNGRTPLSYAAEWGNEEVVRLLTGRQDIEADRKDYLGRTPLSHAAGNKYRVGDRPEAVVKLLAERKDVDVKGEDRDGHTPLWWAKNNEREAVIKILQTYM